MPMRSFKTSVVATEAVCTTISLDISSTLKDQDVLLISPLLCRMCRNVQKPSQVCNIELALEAEVHETERPHEQISRITLNWLLGTKII